MNCANCGGTLLAGPVGEVLRCGYCDGVRFLGGGDGPDGLVLTGPESDVPCPRGCGPLSGGRLGGRPVAACPDCRGVLIKSDAFAPLVAERRRAWKGPEPIPRPVDPADLSRDADCPACDGPMETHPYYGPGATVIDSCAACRIVWLDAGEVARIERAPGRR